MNDTIRAASRRRLGFGVIGCGTIGYHRHLRVLKRMRGVDVAGIVEPDPGRRARAVELVNTVVFESESAMFTSALIDAVVIATPPELHLLQVAGAIASGKHVYCEKPLACGAADPWRLPVHGPGSRSLVAVGFNYRFQPACRNLRKLLRDGAAGRVRAVVSHFTEPLDIAGRHWRGDPVRGGVLCDLASHHVDLYRWLLDDEIDWITAQTRSEISDEDSAIVRAATSRGVELTGYFSYGSGRSQHVVIHGTKGVLDLDLHAGTIHLEAACRRGYGVDRRSVGMRLADIGWRGLKRIRNSYDPSYRNALRAFRDSIVGSGELHPDLATLADGLAALRAINAAAGVPDADSAPAAPVDR